MNKHTLPVKHTNKDKNFKTNEKRHTACKTEK